MAVSTEKSQNTTTSLPSWNFSTKHVQKNLNSGDFIGSQSCLVCATAPRLELLASWDESLKTSDPSDTSDANLAIPIGIVSDFNIQQVAQIQQIYEIGSKRKYTVSSGRTDGQIMVNRAQYDGPSLLRMFYAFYPEKQLDADKTLNYLDKKEQLAKILVNDESEFRHIESTPGYGNFWMNMMSEVFSYPFGILFVQRNSANTRDVNAVFFENCYVQTHMMSISAGQIIVAENSQLTFDRVVPVKCAEVQEAGSSASSGNLNGILGGLVDKVMSGIF